MIKKGDKLVCIYYCFSFENNFFIDVDSVVEYECWADFVYVSHKGILCEMTNVKFNKCFITLVEYLGKYRDEQINSILND